MISIGAACLPEEAARSPQRTRCLDQSNAAEVLEFIQGQSSSAGQLKPASFQDCCYGTVVWMPGRPKHALSVEFHQSRYTQSPKSNARADCKRPGRCHDEPPQAAAPSSPRPRRAFAKPAAGQLLEARQHVQGSVETEPSLCRSLQA